MTLSPAHIPTVSVGIPAYNEAGNIAYLLKELLAQQEAGFVLEHILVVSDASTDETVPLVRELMATDHRISIHESAERLGKSARTNEITRWATSDILVLLDADISMKAPDTLAHLIAPIAAGQADFTSARLLPVPPKAFFEQVLSAGLRFKMRFIEAWQQGNNVYTCNGAERAFAKTMYQALRFPTNIGEDAYSYFYGRQHQFRYQYVTATTIFMKLSHTPADYFKQSTRFIQSKARFVDEFGAAFIRAAYAVPLSLMVESALFTFVRQPPSFSLYLILYVFVKIRSFLQQPLADMWDVSASTKNLQ